MWSNPQFSADLITFTEETPNGKLLLGLSNLVADTSSTTAQHLAFLYERTVMSALL